MAVINENMKDLPISCKYCIYLYRYVQTDYYKPEYLCYATPERDTIDDDLYSHTDKPSWCPLKEI